MATAMPPYLEIDYWSEDFPPGSPVPNGAHSLRTTWDELLWAAITVGRPNRHYVFRHGPSSGYEALFRWSLVRMTLEQSGPRAHRLRRTDAAKTLDPSEKGAVNYFLGMVLCKLFAAKLLDAPWAMHLDVFRPQLNPVLSGRSRPDLIAETGSGDWVAIESKGRISTPSADAKNKAKEQARRVTSIRGKSPVFCVGCITYFKNDVLQLFWRDPEPKGEMQHPIKVTFDDSIWAYYYQPIVELVREYLLFDRFHDEGLFELYRELDLKLRVHPKLLHLLMESQWVEAKRFCIEYKEKLIQDNFHADGIQVIAGPTWLDKFQEYDMG